MLSPETVRAHLDGAAISTYVLCMIVVPLKIACRLTQGKTNLGWDDTLVVTALVFANAFFYETYIGIRPKLGYNADTFELHSIVKFLQFVFAAQLLYAVAIGLIKASLLAFYWRLFSNLILIFICTPVQAQWDITLPGATCLSRRAVYLGASIPNVVTDGLLLILPIPYVWSLHAPVAQRLAVAGMFLLGCFVSVVSLVRLSVFMGLDLSSPNVTYNLSDVFIWSLVEVQVGIICACIPSLRPAVRILGLGKWFEKNVTSGAQQSGEIRSSPYQYPSTSQRSHPVRKPSMFASLFSHLDEEEDSFEMIGKNHNLQGKNDVSVGVTQSRDWHSTDTTDDGDREGISTPRPGVSEIKVKKDWRLDVTHEPMTSIEMKRRG
ncbi:hypothetical protein LTR62_008105 [Meristemomyces frigidus]|uniref:Rhodopsin domain-containing protein n=1 Tax=Meristemomyces frigidus TaxID=1508187 RepID=A0AAN7TBB6_9PEZI|nr:hypothetical protein LTR62_008105 [Meristemomyces frigidus]